MKKGFAILPVILIVSLLAVSALTVYFVTNIGTGGFGSRAAATRMIPPECTGSPLRLGVGSTASTRSASVKNWQTFLNKTEGEKLAVDGYFGSKTQAAVKRFQTKYALTVNGVVDKPECQKRTEIENGTVPTIDPSVPTPTPTSAYVLPPLCKGKSLQTGMKKDSAVTNWQQFLNADLGINLALGDTYNTETKNAAKDFQRKYKITVDGVIGPQTCGKRKEVEATITPTVTTEPEEPTVTEDPSEPTVTTDPENPTITTDPTNPTDTPNSPQTGDVSIVVRLKTQGVIKPANEFPHSMPVYAKLKGPTNTGYLAGELILASDGKWEGFFDFRNIQLGTGYSLLIKPGKHVQKKFCSSTPTETTPGSYNCATGSINLVSGTNFFDLSNVMIFAGDLPVQNAVQNGIIDSADISYILNHLGSTNPSDLAIGDLNFDDVIDTQDRSLIVQSLNVKYDDE